MRISDWSSDVCSSDLRPQAQVFRARWAANVIEKNPSPPDSRRRPFFLSMDDGVPPLLGVNNFSPAHDLAALLEYLIGASGRHILPAPATAPDPPSITDAFEIGRASCWERVCQYVSIPVVAGTLKQKKKTIENKM